MKYLKSPTSVLDNCYLYDNINECVQLIKYHILNDDRIAIIVDSDNDGLCSSYMMYKYLKLQGVTKVKPFIQNGKGTLLRSMIIEINRKMKIIFYPYQLDLVAPGNKHA